MSAAPAGTPTALPAAPPLVVTPALRTGTNAEAAATFRYRKPTFLAPAAVICLVTARARALVPALIGNTSGELYAAALVGMSPIIGTCPAATMGTMAASFDVNDPTMAT